MTGKRTLSALAIAAFVALLRTDARACDVVASNPHTIDPSMQAIDHTPPTFPGPPRSRCWYAPTSPQGCDCGNCGESSWFGFSADATDDMTPRARIGYRLLAESGLPLGVQLPAGPIEPNGDVVQVAFNSETTPSVYFTMRVVAVDLAGNESAPQIVSVCQSGDSECSVSDAPAARPGLGWIAFLALIVIAYHRRRP